MSAITTSSEAPVPSPTIVIGMSTRAPRTTVPSTPPAGSINGAASAWRVRSATLVAPASTPSPRRPA